MVSTDEPITLTPLRAPIFSSPIATFKPVCPPIVGKIASGFSFSMIFATISGVNGST